MKVITKNGSATSAKPENGKGVIVAHLCNRVGGWGSGFVLAVDQLSTAPRSAYRALGKNITLGFTQFIEIEPDFFVANMIAQVGLDKSAVPNGVLVDYIHLRTCLETVLKRAIALNCDVHVPAGMGSGLAGGDKATILGIINQLAGASVGSAFDPTSFPNIYLWEFDDKTANSYVPTTPAKSALTTLADSAMQQSLKRFSGLADDLVADVNSNITENDL